MLSPETLSKFAEWRRKSNDGTITIEEQREAVNALRGDRRTAETPTKTSRASKAPARSSDDLLGDLGV